MRKQLIDLLIHDMNRPNDPDRRRKRWQRIAQIACCQFHGDLCEIGAHVGRTTIKFLKVADEFNRRVLVVDPWEQGTQNCKGKERTRFDERVEQLGHLLDVIRLPSQDVQAIAAMRDRDLAFALVDGLHTYGACKSDILNVKHAGVIVVDDILQMQDVRDAFLDAAVEADRDIVTVKGFREGYLL